MKTRIIGISGSLRRGSYNTALLRQASEMMPPDSILDLASIRDVPLYDADVEQEKGPPPAVVQLKDMIRGADGLLVSTPENNHSLPGVLKNTIDWLSRPPADVPRIFGHLPVGLVGASPGRGGTRFAQAAWLPVLQALGTQPYFGRSIYLDAVSEKIDGSGRIVDARTREVLARYLDGFVAFVREQGGVQRRRRE